MIILIVLNALETDYNYTLFIRNNIYNIMHSH